MIFDQDARIRNEVDREGADGALLKDKNGAIHTVNYMEKILATVLSKISNFIPEGGIWMNTQRPEWNDANNALVGNGVSMVTLYYLRRCLSFLLGSLESTSISSIKVSSELEIFFREIDQALRSHKTLLEDAIGDVERKTFLDSLGVPASEYRQQIYTHSFSGKKATLSIASIKDFCALSLTYLDHSIRANRRSDKLYHAYNIMAVNSNKAITISHLSEMLEGQVAVLSSGFLPLPEAIQVLEALKGSKLYRKDQNSYLLYPNKDLPGFLEKNTIPLDQIGKSALLMRMLQDGNKEIIDRDVNGIIHFNGNFRNADDLKKALNKIQDTAYKTLPEVEEQLILEIYESVYNHKSFTGRSGTFFGYEGLGSIYWHMVSKLRLAALENCLKAQRDGEKGWARELSLHYYDIREGIGVHKSPAVYGAFPTDPYSHTPAGKGAQQPGMTGQVKEDILCRLGELGVFINNGQIEFDPFLLKQSEFLKKTIIFSIYGYSAQ